MSWLHIKLLVSAYNHRLEMHESENQELYDRHHKVSPTLILTKTHIIMSSMKSYETAKRPVLYEVPKFRVRCISGHK